MRVLTSASALLVVCIACTSPAQPGAPDPRYAELAELPEFAVNVERDSAFVQAVGGFRTWSGYETPGLRVVRSADAWTAAWDTLTQPVSPEPPLPSVDFDTEMVVIAAEGIKPSGGHGLLIQHVTETRDTIFVLAESTRPGRNCFTTQALTSPLDARLLPRSDLPVVLMTARLVYDCERHEKRPDR